MKKFKLLVLAFVIGTMNLFATSVFTDQPLTKDNKTSEKKLLSDTAISESDALYNKEVTLKITSAYNSKGEIVILDVQSENEDALISVLETMNNKRRISAIRDYAYNITDISHKE